MAEKKQRFSAPDVAPEAEPGMWSNCLVVGDQIYVCGQAGRDVQGNIVSEDPYEQTIYTFERIKALIEAAGGKMDDIVKLNVYLTDIRHRPAFVEARKKFFTGDFPAAVVAGNLSIAATGILVEIDAWAFKGCSG
jgi:2-iminobutanoate/2-iminopropanoate deaminase